MAHCSVPMCKNDWRKDKTKSLSFHQFPKDVSERKKWIVAVRRDEGPDFQVTDRTYVCSQHFLEDDYVKTMSGIRKLKKGAIPSLFAWSRKRKRRPSPTNRRANVTWTPMSCGDQNTEARQQEQTGYPTPCDHDYATPPRSTEEMLAAAQERIDQLERKLHQHEVDEQVQRFGLQRFGNDPKLIRFYTGFTSYSMLKSFFDSIFPYAEKMITWTQFQRSTSKQSKTMIGTSSCKLALIDQMFMFLHKVRLGSLDLELADKFHISRSSVCRNTITWTNFLYCVLGSQPLWPSKSQVQEHMPPAFRATYNLVRVILDCTELKVQSPSSLLLNSELYSHYKGTTTLKGLVGITPAGAVSFVSTLYSGCISDKHITRVSGILDLLEPGDQVMADKGFTIEDLLAEKNCSLVIPNFLSSKGQFSRTENTENEHIANLRVHVERAIRRFREFHIFDSALTLNLAGTVNQLWSVCCLLTNFQGPLIKGKGK